MRGRGWNPGALHVRMGALVDVFGLEATFEACARVCERDAAAAPRLARADVLRRMARVLRALAAEARERLEEGLATTQERIIGRRTTFAVGVTPPLAHGPEVAYVIVTAVRRSGVRKALGAPRLSTPDAVRAAGGVSQYDLVEFDAHASDGTRLYTDSLPATALRCFASLRTP